MAIRNNHWYDLNSQRAYPLDIAASGLSDTGVLLPDAVIEDLRLRWPITLGKYAFLSALTITEHIVTVMFSACSTLDNSANDAVLLAGISIPDSEYVPNRTYVLETFEEGVGGFITVGLGNAEFFSGNFSTPNQGLLTARAARPSRVPPVSSISTLNAKEKLKGVVNFEALSPLSITKETRIIEGVEYDNVIVFRLVEDAEVETNLVDAGLTLETESVFKSFSGDCGRRVGSKDCGSPEPLETINGIGADCDGILTLQFKGCGLIGRNITDCGIIIDCDLGLSGSCAPPPLPNLETGKLPSETAPRLIPPVIPPEPPVTPTNSISDSFSSVLGLPYCEPFDTTPGLFPLYFSNGSGPAAGWAYAADDSPGEDYCCGPSSCNSVSDSDTGRMVTDLSITSQSFGTNTGLSETNINEAFFTADSQTLFRTIASDVKMLTPTLGAKSNASVLLNKQSSSGLNTYWFVELDIANKSFGIYYWNGVSATNIQSVVVPTLSSNEWFRIKFSAKPTVSQTAVDLAAELEGITDPTITASISASVPSSSWGLDSGVSGIRTDRSKSLFSYFKIEEYPAPEESGPQSMRLPLDSYGYNPLQ